jgi:hypothetical protein
MQIKIKFAFITNMETWAYEKCLVGGVDAHVVDKNC